MSNVPVKRLVIRVNGKLGWVGDGTELFQAAICMCFSNVINWKKRQETTTSTIKYTGENMHTFYCMDLNRVVFLQTGSHCLGNGDGNVEGRDVRDHPSLTDTLPYFKRK